MDLRPRVLDDLGLGAGLGWLVQERHPNLQVELEVVLDRQLPAPVETAMFRIIQEALTNLDRHAGAGAAWLRVWTTNGEVRAVVEDHAVVRRGLCAVLESAGLACVADVGTGAAAERWPGRWPAGPSSRPRPTG